MGQDVVGQNFVGQDVTGAISLGQEVSGAGGSGAGSRESLRHDIFHISKFLRATCVFELSNESFPSNHRDTMIINNHSKLLAWVSPSND